jgi:hypothetical protein
MRWLMILLVLGIAGCAQAVDSEALPSPTATTGLSRIQAPFPTSGLVDYQLGGAYPPPVGTSIVARDSTDSPAPGVYSICYINGFQTQPQDADWWVSLHPDLLLTVDGAPVHDADWRDEILLDTSSAPSRDAIAEIEHDWIAVCATKGFDAVEFDNLDSYSRSSGALTMDDNAALATLLVAKAHDLGLAVGQKNTVELGDRGRDEIGFDFVVAEECAHYSECTDYSRVYGDRVIDIEYFATRSGSIEEACDDPTLPTMTVFRDRSLEPLGSPGYRIGVCS